MHEVRDRAALPRAQQCGWHLGQAKRQVPALPQHRHRRMACSQKRGKKHGSSRRRQGKGAGSQYAGVPQIQQFAGLYPIPIAGHIKMLRIQSAAVSARTCSDTRMRASCWGAWLLRIGNELWLTVTLVSIPISRNSVSRLPTESASDELACFYPVRSPAIPCFIPRCLNLAC